MKKVVFSILILGLFSCQNKMQNPTTQESEDSIQTNSIVKNEMEEDKMEETDFDKFFQKYHTDSIFQINHTKFPLKCLSEDEIGDTTITSIQKQNWEFNDFQDNRTSEYDQYEYVKEISNSNLVFYKMQGIDNGILVMYKFIFDNQKWILDEIENSSY